MGVAPPLTASRLQELLRELLDPRALPAAPEEVLFAADPFPLRCLEFLLVELYGADDEVRRAKIERLRTQCAIFAGSYGDGPVEVLRVPARINVLGEHVDYVSYLPTASLTLGSREHDMVMMFRPSDDALIRGVTTLAGSGAISIDLADAPASAGPGGWEAYLYGRPVPSADWGNYIRGAAFYTRMQLGEAVRRGFDFVVDSSIPPAGGASSSSALTVLAGAALRAANGIPTVPAELARDCARAEWFVGTRGGSMDHTTMCVARRMHTVYISYAKDRFDVVPMKLPQVRWLTFYSHPADKGREVMLEYNERAAVSRLIIPALVGDRAVDELEGKVRLLPESVTLAELEQAHPPVFAECRRAFPALVRDRLGKPLKIRDRALHHLGEARRVAAAAAVLRSVPREADPAWEESALRRLGQLLNESHSSLRELYEVSTPVVEELTAIVASDPNVYGARLMGGGFGGNVLALTNAAHAGRVIERVEERFYRPHARDGRAEQAIMVSTPGDGLSGIDCAGALRAAVSSLNTRWRRSEKACDAVCRLLDRLDTGSSAPEVRPIIVAAGKGVRARASGIPVPKPLVPVAGVPAVLRVIGALETHALLPPVVVASVETEPALRELLRGTRAEFVLQTRALGTGDAVLCAAESMRDFRGRALVVWSTQPVIRRETVRRSLQLAALHPEYAMVLPTAIVEKPYAPILRDSQGRVLASRETHLEQAQTSDRGETNIGLFIASSGAMFAALTELRRSYWRESEGNYDRPRGELGFPNEIITLFAERDCGVLAAPIADPREERGIKTSPDIAACEAYLQEFGDAPI